MGEPTKSSERERARGEKNSSTPRPTTLLCLLQAFLRLHPPPSNLLHYNGFRCPLRRPPGPRLPPLGRCCCPAPRLGRPRRGREHPRRPGRDPRRRPGEFPFSFSFSFFFPPLFLPLSRAPARDPFRRSAPINAKRLFVRRKGDSAGAQGPPRSSSSPTLTCSYKKQKTGFQSSTSGRLRPDPGRPHARRRPGGRQGSHHCR